MTGSEYYLQKLKDSKWIAKARKVRSRDDNKCTVCGSTKCLQVHHTYYVRGFEPWEYPINDLLTLCKGCHKDFHLHQEVEVRDKVEKKIIRIAKESNRKNAVSRINRKKFKRFKRLSIQERIAIEMNRKGLTINRTQ